MKKLIMLLLSAVMILSLFTGCRRQTNGDPTVNSSSDSTTVPSTTRPATRPSTEPTIETTMPDSTVDTGSDFTNGSDSSEDATMNSDARRRDRILPHR